MNTVIRAAGRRAVRGTPARGTLPTGAGYARRWLGGASGSPLAEKYADKVRKRLEQDGFKDIEDFKARVAKSQPSPTPASPAATAAAAAPATPGPSAKVSSAPEARKDASPVKPLADFMDLDRVISSPHSASDIASLWTAYHSAKSGSTGRGYLSAVIPVSSYEEMLAEASRYPRFVLPLRRPPPVDAPPESPPAYEFYLLEWAAHEAPLRRDLGPGSNPRLTTVLLTSLAEFKLRQTYAQPHLVLTNYTDLARSHGIVLMRGEITPASGDGRYWLSQEDAQMLCLGLQRFYLTSARDAARAALLHTFHEEPDRFDWEEVIGHAAL